MEPRKKGQTVHSEARNVIRRVIRRCDREAKTKLLFHPIEHASARVADYTGVSKRTVSRIRKEDVQFGEQNLLLSPGKKRPRSRDKKCYCSDHDRNIIRDIITEFYVEKKVVPSATKLLVAVREKIDFPWEIDTFRRLLKDMGFMWKKCQNIRQILIEKPNVANWRAKYLSALQTYRAQGRNIVYIDESWVDSTLTFSKCWHNSETNGVLKNNSSYRFILVHAGGINGFVPGALMFKSCNTTGEYRSQMNYENFEKWITEQLLPNIPARTVIVMDNAPYHWVQLNKVPSKCAKKADIIDWLVRNNVQHTTCMRKYELHELLDRHRKIEKVYRIDELLKLHGHTTVRFPPHMYELNPIELAWEHVKRDIREDDPSTLSASELEWLILDAINKVTPVHWEKFCAHTQKLENKYWEKDALLEAAMDDLDTGEIESEDDSTDSSDSSEYETIIGF